MGGNKPRDGILGGIIGGIVASILISGTEAGREKSKEEHEAWDREFEIAILGSFSEQVERKRKGYKLKFDINEFKVRPKFVNLLQINEYLYSLEISHGEMRNAAKSVELKSSWKSRQACIESIFKNNIYEGIIRVDNLKPEYWVYSVKERYNYIKIIIRNGEEGYLDGPGKTIEDDFICLDLNEALELAKEMRSFYHTHIERVVILDETNMESNINRIDYENKVLEILPDYYKILEVVRKIPSPKYNEIARILEETKLKNPLYLLYTWFTLGHQLHMDQYYKESIKIIESLLKVDKTLLAQSGLENYIYKKIMYILIDLRLEKKVIELIQSRYKDDYRFMNTIAKELYGLQLYRAADHAYKVVIENQDLVSDRGNVTEAYIRTQNDKGVKLWREKLINEGEGNWEIGKIDRYLNDEDIEGLKVKILGYENEENWKEVINYCNKHNRLILLHPWKNMDERIEYELKKVNAYIQMNNYKAAWNSSCKTRSILLSNFNGIDYFEYLSKIESYMSSISLQQNYFIDALYHYIMKGVYRDIFNFYESNIELNFDWSQDLSLQALIEKASLGKTWYRIENIIKGEYNNISGKTIRNINIKIINALKENNYKLTLDQPKKYYPNTIANSFNLE